MEENGYYINYSFEDERTYDIEQRCVRIAFWLLDHKSHSIRHIAKEFGMGKSQVHRDIHRLKHLNDDLYVQCKTVLKKHKGS